ncbi:MAG TPA: maleylpyruvate isomerase N-terminal domain-containing protein [Candidatus Dormibacteraeota bacterium]
MSVAVRPARINTFAAEGKDHLLHVVRKEREDFYDVIDRTDDESWKTQTACTEWEVRDVVGHLLDVTEGYLERFALARNKEAFPEPLGLPGMAKLLDTGAKRFRELGRTQTIARLKQSSDKLFKIFDALSPDEYTTEMIPHVYMGPLPTMIYPAFQLIDYSVHTWDMRAGLGELKPLSEDAANTLIPYMFIVLQVTVDEQAAKGFDATWGVRISGDAGGSWKLMLKDGKLSYEEGSMADLPVVFNFDANDWVLTAYQRFPGGAVIGDRQLAYKIRRLFFKI